MMPRNAPSVGSTLGFGPEQLKQKDRKIQDLQAVKATKKQPKWDIFGLKWEKMTFHLSVWLKASAVDPCSPAVVILWETESMQWSLSNQCFITSMRYCIHCLLRAAKRGLIVIYWQAMHDSPQKAWLNPLIALQDCQIMYYHLKRLQRLSYK